MLDFEEAKRNLALPMHGLLINGGTAHAIGCSAQLDDQRPVPLIKTSICHCSNVHKERRAWEDIIQEMCIISYGTRKRHATLMMCKVTSSWCPSWESLLSITVRLSVLQRGASGHDATLYTSGP